MSTTGENNTSLKDLVDWSSKGDAAADFLQSQINNILEESPAQSERMIHDTLEFAAQSIGGVWGKIAEKVLYVVEFAEPSFPTEDAQKANNSTLRWLIDYSNAVNEALGHGKKIDHYPDGPTLDDTNPLQKKLDDWNKVFEDLKKVSGLADPKGNISSAVNKNFQTALIVASPIVLDLDGDGIETTAENGQVLFDHDGDGVKNGSGWVASDDGLLALDLNGNGTIDSGRELFGTNTVLADGSKAEDGFEAMQASDGNADGKLDANDAIWADLRVWRDLNKDGVSQSGELFRMQDLGIESISTGSDGIKTDLGNKNYIDGSSTFQWDQAHGGGTGDSADVYFEDNKFFREFIDSVEVPAELANLPDMHGSGALRDLREAAVGSQSLQETLAAYSQAGTRLEQQALLGKLVNEWANTANFRTFDERIADLSSDGRNIAFAYSWDVGGNTQPPTAAQLEKQELLGMVKVLEVFNGKNLFEFNSPTGDGSGGSVYITYIAGVQSRTGSAVLSDGTFYLTEGGLDFGVMQEASIRAAYQAGSTPLARTLSSKLTPS